jgi:hypothetical protein
MLTDLVHAIAHGWSALRRVHMSTEARNLQAGSPIDMTRPT